MIGELPDPMLQAMPETLPIEFSVLDADDRVLGWNKHDSRVFKRPEAVIGRDVRPLPILSSSGGLIRSSNFEIEDGCGYDL